MGEGLVNKISVITMKSRKLKVVWRYLNEYSGTSIINPLRADNLYIMDEPRAPD